VGNAILQLPSKKFFQCHLPIVKNVPFCTGVFDKFIEIFLAEKNTPLLLSREMRGSDNPNFEIL